MTDTVEMLVGRLGMPDVGGSYFTFSNENNDLIWGFLAECHRRGWIYKGHDSMPWCPRCGTGLSPDGDERGLPGPRGPRADRPLPARRPAGRVAARLDDDALDAGRERRRRGRAGPALRPGPPGRRRVLARPRDRSSRRSRGRSRSSRSGPGADLVGWRYAGPFDDLPAVARRVRATSRPYEHRVVAWAEVGEEEGTGIVHIAPGLRRRGLPARQVARAAGRSAPIDEDGRYFAGFGWLTGREAPATSPSAIVDDLERQRLLLPPRGVQPPLPALLAVRHAARCSASSTSGSSAWARSTTSRARR